MNAWLMKAPWWVPGLMNAVILGVFWVLYLRFGAAESWTHARVQAGLFGLVGGRSSAG